MVAALALLVMSPAALVPGAGLAPCRPALAMLRVPTPLAQQQGIQSQLVEQLVDKLADASPSLFGSDPEVKALWPLVPLRIAAGLLMIVTLAPCLDPSRLPLQPLLMRALL